MKNRHFLQAFVLLVCILGLAAIHGCGGGGGGGGTPTPNAPSITTASLPAGVRGQLYSVVLVAAGGTTPYGWSATGLPPGISLDAATGVLSGTPTTDNSYAPTFTVTDNGGLTDSKSIPIVIQPFPSPSVSTASLPSGVRTQPYSASLSATSGTPPYTWTVTAGSLPPGVALSDAGALTGTPTANGTFSPTFTVTDNNGLTGSQPLSILINPPGSPVITTTSLPAGARTEPYSASLSATSGTPPYTWTVTAGILPAGIALSAAGELTGTPSVEGTFTPVFTVTDSAARQAVKPLDLRIAKPLVLFVADFSTPSGAVDMFDNASVANGDSAWTRQLKGTLTTLDSAVGGPPAGVSYDAARKILYVARFQGSDNGAVLAFNNADTVDGDASPNRILRTIIPAFSLNSPSDVFIDSGNDRLYIADVTGSSGTIIIMDSASASPTFRKIFSFPPALGPPAAISVDIGRDILYVVPSQGSTIIAYDNISKFSSPQRTITIGSTPGVGLVDVKIDPATDTAYVADYDGGRVLVIDRVSQKSGTYTPERTLTGLTNPNSVFPDVANDRLFVSNRDGATSYSVRVVENISFAAGPVSFSRQLSGFGTAAGMTGFYK